VHDDLGAFADWLIENERQQRAAQASGEAPKAGA